MTEPQDLTIQVIKRARELIYERGWDYHYSSSPTSTLNIRSAVSTACSEMAGDDGAAWHVLYRQAIACIGTFLKDGIMSWEFGTHANRPRRREQAEVMEMLTQVIHKLEAKAARKGGAA